MLINYWGNLQRTNQIHYMKKYLLLLLSLLSLQSFAAENQVVQEVAVVESVVEEPAYNPQYRDVPPTFLGIPIDGPKSEFIAKLKQKGFVNSDYEDLLEGKFGGEEVKLCVVTNSSGVVYSVAVFYKEVYSEYAFINHYNFLYNLLLDSSKYSKLKGELLTMSDLDAIKNNPENMYDRRIEYLIAMFEFKIGSNLIRNAAVNIGLQFFPNYDIYRLVIEYSNYNNNPYKDL